MGCSFDFFGLLSHCWWVTLAAPHGLVIYCLKESFEFIRKRLSKILIAFVSIFLGLRSKVLHETTKFLLGDKAIEADF